MKKTLSALVISSLLFGANVQAAALSADQEKEVRALVRDTLIKNPEILEEAITALQAQKADEQQAQFRTALKAEHDALYNDAASPRIGAKDAKLVLVSFTDYNCPYCKRFDPLLEQITKDYPEVAVVIKPLPFKGESSAKASQAVLSVWKEDPKAFLALHQRLMQKKTMLDNASIDDAMKTTNTSKVKLTDESLKALQNNLDLSRKLGIQGTPATVVGDMVIPGAVDYAQLEVIVKEQLAKVKKIMRSRLRKWSKELIVLVVIFVIASFAMDWWRQPTPPSLTNLPELYTVDNKVVSLAELSAEKPLLIYFWATWCGVCKLTTPAVNSLAQDGYNVTSVAIRSGDNAKLARGIQSKGLVFPVINDSRGDISQQWEISATPSFVIVYKGEMVGFTSGWSSSWGLKLRLWWASI